MGVFSDCDGAMRHKERVIKLIRLYTEPFHIEGHGDLQNIPHKTNKHHYIKEIQS